MFFNRGGSKKRAFTLAEVLITLAIIGVIAAMTIPTLLTSYNRRNWETRMRKDFSIAVNMCQRAMAEDNVEKLNETTLYSVLGNEDAAAVRTEVSKYLQTTSPITQVAEGEFGAGSYSMEIADSSIILARRIDEFNGLGFYIDVNGFGQLPNELGYDRFGFNLGQDCEYTDSNAVNDVGYGTFKDAMRHEWRLPNRPVDWVADVDD